MTTRPITGDTWGDEIEGPRTYILGQAAKTLPELRADFDRAHAAFAGQLRAVSESQAGFKPGRSGGEEDYSIIEVTRHVIQVYPIMGGRITSLARAQEGPSPAGPGSLGGHQGASLAELAGHLQSAHDALIEQIRGVEGTEDLAPTLAHRLFGELNCRGWLAMTVLHLEDHARQVAKVKLHPGYPPA